MMKKFLLLLIILSAAFCNMQTRAAQPKYKVSGTVVDENDRAVEFATVTLLAQGSEAAGVVADARGDFALSAPAGDYTLQIRCIGYQTLDTPLRLDTDRSLGRMVLAPATVEMDAVVVKRQAIVREADRFVVNVAESPQAIGRDAQEMLAKSPGMWLTDNKITINGKSGAKIIINDRELKMDDEEAIAYLRTIKAEDIQKIEIIPTAGADYDADAAGGVVKITLRKQRLDGMTGNLAISYLTSHGWGWSASPSASFNYHRNRFSLTSSGWYSKAREKAATWERSRYFDRPDEMTGESVLRDEGYGYGGRIGLFYDISPRQQLGAEASWNRNTDETLTDNASKTTSGSEYIDQTGDYFTHRTTKTLALTFNYIVKLDTLGSTFKLLGSYTSRVQNSPQDYFSTMRAPSISVDSTYRSLAASDHKVYTLTAALEKNTSFGRFSSGAKFTYNDMMNNSLYEYLSTPQQSWSKDLAHSSDNNYAEKIAAFYAIYAHRIRSVGIQVGLRGEYTHVTPKYSQEQSDGTTLRTSTRQEYFSLFPNANISVALNKKKSSSLILSYARKIRRPSFWALAPIRQQVSEYTYIIGNPDLKPLYNDQISATLVLWNKVSLTAGLDIRSNETLQILQSDPSDPDLLMLRQENIDKTSSLFVSLNAPITVTSWWNMNLNAYAARNGQRIRPEDPQTFHPFVFTTLSNDFTLPLGFYLEATYSLQGKIYTGNFSINSTSSIDMSLKKQLFNKKVTASFAVQNLYHTKYQNVETTLQHMQRTNRLEQFWSSRKFKFTLRYNFNRGTKFRVKNIENAAGEESSRLNQSN